MSRPKVTLEKYQEVYDYYGDRRPNPKVAKIGHATLGAVYRVNTSYAKEAETNVRELLATGTRFLIAANHTTNHDPVVIASLVQREEVLRPLIANARIAAKPPLFHKPGLRWLIDELGAIPVFRTQDSSETQTALQKKAAELYKETCISLLEEGEHVALFPEGTRNKRDVRQVQPVRFGLEHIALGAAESSGIAILPIGISYPGAWLSRFRPNVHVGTPIEVVTTMPTGLITQEVQLALQASVRQAASPASA